MSQPSSPTTTASASDIVRDHWTLRLAPPATRPYLRLIRLDRPIGIWLLLFPGWWSLSLAAAVEGRWPDWRLVALFGAGAVLMRGAGCTYNDIVDRDIDSRVVRTASRPIPSGEVSVARAIIYMVALAGLAFLILLQLTRSPSRWVAPPLRLSRPIPS